MAYYAAHNDNNNVVAAAKFCPLHTQTAAKFYGGDDWRHVYCLQRLAAVGLAENELSRFVGWCLREIGKDQRVWYVVTYADTGIFNPAGVPHTGGIYRATNAVYCGITKGGNKVIGYRLDGQRHHIRKGGRTLRVRDIPPEADILRSSDKHRYCWPVGTGVVQRTIRRRFLRERFRIYKFESVYQPRLLTRLNQILKRFFTNEYSGTHYQLSSQS